MVKNMEESLKFYKDIVGLKENRSFQAGPGTQIVFLGEGDTQVELICNEQKQEVTIGQDISLGFEVPSVDEMIALLKDKGVEIQSGPMSPNPHVKFFYVLDPNGVKIQFVENM
jgi:lactoylglutathione lyase